MRGQGLLGGRAWMCQSWRLMACRLSTRDSSSTAMASFRSCLFAITKMAAPCRCSCSSRPNSSPCSRAAEPTTSYGGQQHSLGAWAAHSA